MPDSRPIRIATRGSALALAQANWTLGLCRVAFPGLSFELKVIRTTGDKLETAALAQNESLPKGLFTKELEVALLDGQADFAVHSLKDLPTELPPGLKLGAVTRRADVRDAVIFRRDAGQPGSGLQRLSRGAVVGTSSTRRRAQLLALRPDLRIVEVRGNIVTRLQKLSARRDFDALILAVAGLERMNFEITGDGHLAGAGIPADLSAAVLDVGEMLPCVGQGALGIEVRSDDAHAGRICESLNHFNTARCVTAERAFLAAMGGGCASPVAALAEIIGRDLHMQALSCGADGSISRAAGICDGQCAADLGRQLAGALKEGNPALRNPGGVHTYVARESST